MTYYKRLYIKLKGYIVSFINYFIIHLFNLLISRLLLIMFYNIFKTIPQKIPKRLEPIKTPGGLSRQEGDSWIGVELFVEFDHFVQREVGAHVAVQDEEGGRVAGTNLITEVVNTAGGPQRSVFL